MFFLGRPSALLTSISPGWKGSPRANTLAYMANFKVISNEENGVLLIWLLVPGIELLGPYLQHFIFSKLTTGSNKFECLSMVGLSCLV